LGRDLHGVEERGRFFGLDAAMQHEFADFGNCGLDGGSVFEAREVDVIVRKEFIAATDGSFAHDFVILATSFAVNGGHSAGITTGVSHLTMSVGVFFVE
jgi:hypothetical protein